MHITHTLGHFKISVAEYWILNRLYVFLTQSYVHYTSFVQRYLISWYSNILTTLHGRLIYCFSDIGEPLWTKYFWFHRTVRSYFTGITGIRPWWLLRQTYIQTKWRGWEVSLCSMHIHVSVILCWGCKTLRQCSTLHFSGIANTFLSRLRLSSEIYNTGSTLLQGYVMAEIELRMYYWLPIELRPSVFCEGELKGLHDCCFLWRWKEKASRRYYSSAKEKRRT